MFYVIETEYVGPNTLDSQGNIIGDSSTMIITNKIPLTNMSQEELTEGWLGTTNNFSAHARGEFKTLDLAMKYLAHEGYVREIESEKEGVISEWQTESASREKWDAGTYLLDGAGTENIIKEYAITENTTDEELDTICTRIEKEAVEENINLFGTIDVLIDIRDELI